MVRTVPQLETVDLINRITALYDFFNENQDIQTAERAKDLAFKLDKQEYSIAFCGHFSAGKSSMINKIIGENLLPSSPIPTSANLVKIKSGEDYAKVIFKEERPRLYPAPYDYNQVKSYCKDGDQIHSIEISYSDTSLPKNAVIMDTPGIDSTDDAHRIATESALHLADLVFYVMDYNHVQSELNFLFTKELAAAGKQVYLIINQIDKHRDEELSFDQFKQSVKDSFASWGVTPERIFYTSLKNEDHKENEFLALQKFIADKIANSEWLLPESVYHSLKKLSSEHLIYLEEKSWAEIEKYEKRLEELPLGEREALSEKVTEIEEKLKAGRTFLKTTEINFINKVDDVLDNAYLMPFQTRELAENYIESCQSGFKVGLFFSRQKTEQERANRLELFFQDLSEKVKSQIDWHIKELMINELKQLEVHDSDLLGKAQNYSVDFNKDLLGNTVKEGALLSGDYVLQYTNDLAESIKKLAKNSLADFKELLLNTLSLKTQKEQSLIDSEWKLYKGYKDDLQMLTEIKESLRSAKVNMNDLLEGKFSQEKYEEMTKKLLSLPTEEVEIIHQTNETVIDLKEASNVLHEIDNDLQEASDRVEEKAVNALVEKLYFTANSIQDVPGFKNMTSELLQKAERLKDKQFTVALFGAFSAGKSSFANALIGHKLLPVSPNPTTAAINKIMPVNDQFDHGTVLVKVKSAEILFDDVKRSLKVFSQSAADFDDAIAKIRKVMSSITDFDANEKTHFAFLNAFLRGFDAFREILGTTVRTDLEEFKGYVAIEEKSCFVDMIEVYYDCELTRKGITLVDTPGADSINARHTGVAFDYIKNSDAILFVTYYNHAFSKADREFLIQLGRVKDSFELDKMFFVVNAIDLANNEEEKESVLQYVGEQLVQYGIRRPNLFGLSSLEALTEKLENREEKHSKIDRFEASFYAFITNELMQISITSAQLGWNRVMEQLRSFIQSSYTNKELKAQRRIQLEDELSTILNLFKNQDAAIFTQRLEQEADELVFYIKQRVFLRFGDFIKEAFNPAALKDDGRNLKKALQAALEDFLQSFGFDFAQELRATTLRLEAYIGKLCKQAQDMQGQKVAEINKELRFSQYETRKMEGIEFDTAFISENRAQFSKALAHFKNPKSFFEKNERKNLSDELEQLINPLSEHYLQTEGERLKKHYAALLIEEYSHMLTILAEQANEYYEGLLAVLRDDFPIEELEKTEQEITHFSLES
ncbi:dynamin family protein [Bacillus sp. DTU_2020_1000418_1_SI_GHA_SEK_038]|uniref:dynamin family protein n=1 Tax=Bacillus sp. DTU_2020_1000418_1_SI_GHA_SEK_038 TaxID=3077585 RepID=UPI0028F01738|nr:dynamin family protein [Bacillus sp. DTU_2020_1000418_1_SI_GHA_SEK_038]WNS73963.1 dynamin family protein [Bacillus sp. DTU_2020_1000418_1_SI_GHA_SEK_038]